MDIIQAVLDSNDSAVEDPHSLHALAANLGVAHRATEIGMRIASTAFRAGRFVIAHQEALLLSHAGYIPAGELCGQLAVLGSEGGAPPAELKELLAFAMAHSPNDQVQPLV